MRQSSVVIVKKAILDFISGKQATRKLKGYEHNGERLYNMFRLLAVCHTAVVEKEND
jgi:hypothetical protein